MAKIVGNMSNLFFKLHLQKAVLSLRPAVTGGMICENTNVSHDLLHSFFFKLGALYLIYAVGQINGQKPLCWFEALVKRLSVQECCP